MIKNAVVDSIRQEQIQYEQEVEIITQHINQMLEDE
jgi:hypothetical protein